MRQTTRIDGARVVINTSKAGKVTIKPAPALEADLQAEQCTAMRKHPAYGKRFTFAADMNAEKRGPKARALAVRTGMVSGEPDLRLYFIGGRLVVVENKVGNGPLSPAQKDRHALLRRLGFDVHVIRADTPAEAVRLLMEIVDAELAAIAA
jgi:hypothetical protein